MSDFESPGSHRRRRRSGSPRSSSRRRSRSRRSGSPRSSRRRRRSRSRSLDAGPVSPVSPSRRSDGFQYTKGMDTNPSVTSPGSVGGMSQSSRGYPSFDARDNAPEDSSGRMYSRDCAYSSRPGYPGDTDVKHRSAPMVRGSLRLEGVDFSKYEGLKHQPDVQRLFTTALRDDLISEAGNGVTREDILLKLTPGPIKTVVLDYGDSRQPAAVAPTLVDAEWSMDVEYAISARSEASQLKIAKALFEALSNTELDVRATRAAYVRYINHTFENPWKIQAVPCVRNDEPAIHYTERHGTASNYSGPTHYSPPPSRNVFGSPVRYERMGGSSGGSPHSQQSNALSPARSTTMAF